MQISETIVELFDPRSRTPRCIVRKDPETLLPEPDPKRGEWRTQSAPACAADVELHLQGHQILGLAPAAWTRWVTWDVDAHDGDDARARGQVEAMTSWLVNELRAEPLVESTMRGYHVTILADVPVEAVALHHWATRAAAEACGDIGVAGVEVFPSGGEGGKGLRLPGAVGSRIRDLWTLEPAHQDREADVAALARELECAVVPAVRMLGAEYFAARADLYQPGHDSEGAPVFLWTGPDLAPAKRERRGRTRGRAPVDARVVEAVSSDTKGAAWLDHARGLYARGEVEAGSTGAWSAAKQVAWQRRVDEGRSVKEVVVDLGEWASRVTEDPSARVYLVESALRYLERLESRIASGDLQPGRSGRRGAEVLGSDSPLSAQDGAGALLDRREVVEGIREAVGGLSYVVGLRPGARQRLLDASRTILELLRDHGRVTDAVMAEGIKGEITVKGKRQRLYHAAREALVHAGYAICLRGHWAGPPKPRPAIYGLDWQATADLRKSLGLPEAVVQARPEARHAAISSEPERVAVVEVQAEADAYGRAKAYAINAALLDEDVQRALLDRAGVHREVVAAFLAEVTDPGAGVVSETWAEELGDAVPVWRGELGVSLDQRAIRRLRHELGRPRIRVVACTTGGTETSAGIIAG